MGRSLLTGQARVILNIVTRMPVAATVGRQGQHKEEQVLS
jgi:hypothetical protein